MVRGGPNAYFHGLFKSTRYWAQEYHVDGFRFDLMAIHDIETMNMVAAALKEVNRSEASV